MAVLFLTGGEDFSTQYRITLSPQQVDYDDDCSIVEPVDGADREYLVRVSGPGGDDEEGGVFFTCPLNVEEARLLNELNEEMGRLEPYGARVGVDDD